MREILFRGKRVDNGEWVEGSLILTTAVQQKPYIVDSCWCECGKVNDEGFADFNWLNAFEVIPKTIGQYTGLTDKNGTKIFEGDIIRAFMDFGPAGLLERIALVGWHDKYGYQWNYFDTDTIEVIGNINDNPELLKGGVQE